jgi:geranylgeranyl pyrophosphate synthase
MNDLVKRKKTLPVVLAFERASSRVRAQLDELFAPPAPLAAENVDRIRTILDDLGVRPLLEREIEAHRARALHLLHGVGTLDEPRRLLAHLVASATGAADEPAAAGTLSA